MSETILIKYGRYSCVIRPHLRAFLASKKNKNAYVNDLLEKEFKKPKQSAIEQYKERKRRGQYSKS